MYILPSQNVIKAKNKTLAIFSVIAIAAILALGAAVVASHSQYAFAATGHERACQNEGAAGHNPHCNDGGVTGGLRVKPVEGCFEHAFIRLYQAD